MVLRYNSELGDILDEIENMQKLNPIQELIQLIFYLNPLFKRWNRACFDLIEFKDENFYQEPEKIFELRNLSGYSIVKVEKKLNVTSNAFNIDEFDPSNINPDNFDFDEQDDFTMDLDELPDLDDYFEDPDLFEYEEDDDFNEEDWD